MLKLNGGRSFSGRSMGRAMLVLMCGLAVQRVSAQADTARFAGAPACARANCHGGPLEKGGAYTLWSKEEAHARARTALDTPQAAEIGTRLGIKNVGTDMRCAVCHAPLEDIPATRLLPKAKASEGVGCEVCHGPAGDWIMTHTQPDLSPEVRTLMGMHNLGDLLTRANTCVRCHEGIDPAIVAAGHAAVSSEMARQTEEEPRHWKEKPDYSEAQAWLVGQAVALRVASTSLERGGAAAGEEVTARWRGLYWVVREAQKADEELSGGEAAWPVSPPDAKTVGNTANKLATAAAKRTWEKRQAGAMLAALSLTYPQFGDKEPGKAEQFWRARRLVGGLDRLLASVDPENGNSDAHARLAAAAAQTAKGESAFDSAAFADSLAAFQRAAQPLAAAR